MIIETRYRDSEREVNDMCKKDEFKGFNWENGLWVSRYYTKLYHPDCVAVKVEGGYCTMTPREYRIWRNQK